MCSSPCRREWASECQFMALSAHYLNSTNIGGQNRELLSLDLEKINKKGINGLYRFNYDYALRQDEQQGLNNKIQVNSKQVCLRKFKAYLDLENIN